MRTTNRSLRSVRLQASLPRALAAVLVALLCASGLRTILTGPPQAAPARTVVRAPGDQGAEAFAEGFARAYLTWDPAAPEARERALKPFLASALDADAGMRPADRAAQDVEWTAVAGDRREGPRRLVTIVARTSRDLIYVSVPVARDDHGFLAVAALPAIVGPPASGTGAALPTEDLVEDTALAAVVRRAVANYLAGNRGNLLADLTPDAVVSIPAQRLKVAGDGSVSWVTPGRRVAVAVDAQDTSGNSWSLRYELEVRRRDRWYVRSLQVDPTFRGEEQ